MSQPCNPNPRKGLSSSTMPAVNLITAVPNFVSPEEHRNIIASTPSSFNDIPPVLRHREENVSVKLDPPIENFTEQDAAQGTLYVITRCEKKKPTREAFHIWLSISVLVFISTTGRGFQIAYPAITLHAISRSEQGSPSIYCQLDDTTGANGVTSPAMTSEGEEEDTELRELSIFPKNPDSRTYIRPISKKPHTRPFLSHSHIFFTVEKIFECLSLCAALHPDLDNESDEDDAFIDSSNFEAFTGDEEQELSEVGRVRSDFVNDNRFAPY